jgi:hypothetical protein
VVLLHSILHNGMDLTGCLCDFFRVLVNECFGMLGQNIVSMLHLIIDGVAIVSEFVIYSIKLVVDVIDVGFNILYNMFHILEYVVEFGIGLSNIIH